MKVIKLRIKLIVGLGNPGKEYENTRHNMGFRVLDNIANNLQLGPWKEKYNALFIDTFINNQKVIFVKPQNYINLSGNVMIKFVNFFDIKLEDILIINDDLDLPLGTIKLKEKGSSGGHNGLKNIEAQLKTSEYKRIKLGISNDKLIDTKDYVLGKLSKEEEELAKIAIENASLVAVKFLTVPFHELMSKYNTKIKN